MMWEGTEADFLKSVGSGKVFGFYSKRTEKSLENLTQGEEYELIYVCKLRLAGGSCWMHAAASAAREDPLSHRLVWAIW